MATPYRPRAIKTPQSGMVYLLTCKDSQAAEFAEFMKSEGIPAELTEVSLTEYAESDDDAEPAESYVVRQIAVEPPADYELANRAITKWVNR